eukprot:scaffold224865_cov31-Tisochrysis_lutea.AAC.1
MKVPPPPYSCNPLSGMIPVRSGASRCKPRRVWPAEALYLTMLAAEQRNSCNVSPVLGKACTTAG